VVGTSANGIIPSGGGHSSASDITLSVPSSSFSFSSASLGEYDSILDESAVDSSSPSPRPPSTVLIACSYSSSIRYKQAKNFDLLCFKGKFALKSQCHE